MRPPRSFRWLQMGTAAAFCIVSPAVLAAGFGIFDPRTLALGGASVALGDLATGHLYNPAITALHQGDEDRTQDGYHSLLATVGSVSEGARTATDAISDDLEQRLYDAIDRFNAELPALTPNTLNLGETAARDLRDAMQDLTGAEIAADGYFGYTVSEPGDGQGGAFFIGARIVGAGTVDIGPGDVALIEDYVEELQSIQAGAAPGTLHPELFADGQLNNPSDQIESEADARGAALVEFGVSAARSWQLPFGVWSVGAAPKAVSASFFDEQWRVADGGFDSSGTIDRHLYLNIDLGTSVTLGERWLIAVAVKDALPRSLSSSLGGSFEIDPKPRLGLAYQHSRLRAGLDVDLVASPLAFTAAERQDLSLGFEFDWSAVQLRLGYRHDLASYFSGMATAGIGLNFGGVSVDLAYAEGGNSRGAALRLGFRH